MKRLALVIAALTIAAPAMAADAPKTMDIVDFLVDRADLTGKTITLTGCKMFSASPSFFGCSGPEWVSVSWPKGDKEVLRRGMRECDSIGNGNCTVTVTGTVAKVSLRMGIRATSVTWDSDKQ